jgi:predicted PhzF superfamily epimerase YddE/YHI9
MTGIVHYLFDLDHAWRRSVENPIFHIVDVFAEEKYAGNQLAVFRGWDICRTRAIGRPAFLYLRARKEGGEISVSVGRKVPIVAKGELL